MKRLLSFSALASAIVVSACASDAIIASTSAGAGAGGGGPTTIATTTTDTSAVTASTTSSSTSSTTATSSSGAGGGDVTCGGIAGTPCPSDQYCDFPDDQCGGNDGAGTCKPRPQGCTTDDPGACGCDGKIYSNACEAAAAGFDVSSTGCQGDCVQTTAALTSLVQALGDVQQMTFLVRLDSQYAILDWSLVSGTNMLDEAGARDVAKNTIGFGDMGALISGPQPVDEWIFYSSVPDNTELVAVSARGGAAIFGARIGLAGTSYPYPATSKPASDLGIGCGNGAISAPARIVSQGTSNADLQMALGAINNTALPAAITSNVNLKDVVVVELFGGTPDYRYAVMINAGTP